MDIGEKMFPIHVAQCKVVRMEISTMSKNEDRVVTSMGQSFSAVN